MNFIPNSASSSAIVVEDTLVNHYVSTSTQTTRTPTQLAAIYKENIEAADEAALIESAILSRQHALEIECILVERNAYPTAAVLNTIRTAQLIEQEAQLVSDPAVKHSILHYQKRIRGLCYLLLPSDIKRDIREAISIILDRTTTTVARPPSPHCLDEYIRIPSLPLSEVPKPVLPPATPRVAANDPLTNSMPDLELGTQAAPIVVEDFSPPPSPNTRIARREQKRRLRISSKSASPVKQSTRISPTASLPDKPFTLTDYNNFICRNCKALGHRHKNCPDYWCRVCHKQQPGHLSIYCKKLKEKQVREKIREPPTTAFENPDFYTHMKIWEAHVNEDVARAYEKERDEALNEFEEHYLFDDDPINYANQDD
ncbi:hypothetical protein EDD22DRAFT_949918 [Suillus occidentalis]|nr:hypothetical protein EDD22DRAFT_949918 [Suillus occidentalis]